MHIPGTVLVFFSMLVICKHSFLHTRMPVSPFCSLLHKMQQQTLLALGCQLLCLLSLNSAICIIPRDFSCAFTSITVPP